MKFILIAVTVFLLFASCSNERQPVETINNNDIDKKITFTRISPEQAKEMMVEGNIVLDVRTKDEYDQGHIPGAVLLPVQDILNKKLDLLPDKDQTILVYCRSGNRSVQASRSLVRSGYTNVFEFGGIINWPYEIVK